MPLLTEYYKNTCLQDIKVNMSVSTPPMHIGRAQVLCSSHCRYQIGVTDLDDTKNNRLSVTINSSVAVTIHFSSLILTFLIFFLKICDLQRKVAITSAGSWFNSLIILLTEQYLPISMCVKKNSSQETWCSSWQKNPKFITIYQHKLNNSWLM